MIMCAAVKQVVVYSLISLSAAWAYGGCGPVNVVEVFVKRDMSGPEMFLRKCFKGSKSLTLFSHAYLSEAFQQVFHFCNRSALKAWHAAEMLHGSTF